MTRVRIGGGPDTIRQYLIEGLFAGLDLPALGYECVESVGTEKATHIVLRR